MHHLLEVDVDGEDSLEDCFHAPEEVVRLDDLVAVFKSRFERNVAILATSLLEVGLGHLQSERLICLVNRILAEPSRLVGDVRSIFRKHPAWLSVGDV